MLKVVLKIISLLILILFGFFIITYREKNTLEDKIHLANGSNFIQLSNGSTQYQIAGDKNGIPVVLVHGLSVGMYDWDHQFDFLVNNGFRVLRYNHYGRGFSDRPDVKYDKKLYISQLDELIRKHFNKEVILIGHSLGGGIVAEYTSRNPDTIKKAVLISPILNPGKDNTIVDIIKIPFIGDYLVVTILPHLLIERAEGLFNKSGVDTTRYLAQFKLQTTIKGFSNSIKSLLRNNAFKSYENAYRNLNGDEILIIWGDEDLSVPQVDTESIISLIPGITKRSYHGVGHSPNLEIWETVNQDILSFIQ